MAAIVVILPYNRRFTKRSRDFESLKHGDDTANLEYNLSSCEPATNLL